MSLTIRPATLDDLEEVTRLYLVLRDHHRRLDPTNIRYQVGEQGWREHAERVLADAERGNLLAERDGSVVGYISCFFAQKPWGLSWEIQTLVVDEPERGAGVGKALMEEAERIGIERGAAGLRLDVISANVDARRFYEALGYREIAVRFGKEIPRPAPADRER